MLRTKTLEILTKRDGKWSIEGVAHNLEDAQKAAGRLLADPSVDGVRVVPERVADIQNLKPSDILFEKMRPAGGAERIAVGDIQSAPQCEEAEELFSGAARRTINRLFRAYLDKNGLTASEVLHNYRELKRAMDFESLVPSAVGKVAQLQARGSEGETTNGRRDMLFSFVNRIADKARKVDGVKLPKLGDGIDTSIKEIEERANGLDAGYLFRVAASRELIEIRDWWGKFARTVGWADECSSPTGTTGLDAFISDALNNPTVLQDLLGDQGSLAEAMLALMALADGALEPDPENAAQPGSVEATAAQLVRLFASDRLPESYEAILERVRRQLEGSAALAKDKDAEKDAFRTVLDRIVPAGDLVGGPEMAEAITHRQSRIINKGGAGGLKEATAMVLPELQDPSRKASYLLALFESRIGQEILKDEIDQHLSGLFMTPSSVNQIVRDSVPPNKKMEKVTSIFYRIQKSNLPDSRKIQLTQHLDDLLASYIVDGKILEKLDNPDKPLHIRAFMLVSMCQPEMLPNGKASKLAREIIVKNLRRPNFETELIAEVPDGQKEKVLRDFHVQLRRSGFFG